jgi:hypothetical protein
MYLRSEPTDVLVQSSNKVFLKDSFGVIKASGNNLAEIRQRLEKKHKNVLLKNFLENFIKK